MLGVASLDAPASRGRLIRGTGCQNVPLLLFILLQLFAECSQRNDQVPQNIQKGSFSFNIKTMQIMHF